MKKRIIKHIKSTAVPLPVENIDTDQIVPARFLKATSREGFGDHVFRDLRFDPEGNPKAHFVLNMPHYKGEILIAGHNFGCGSSREHAAWALSDYGFRAVVSSFFADIFRNNALNNNLLPVGVSPDFLKMLFDAVFENPKTVIDIDVAEQVISVPALKMYERFEINPYKKLCVMSGYDDIDYLLSMKDNIEKFERKYAEHITNMLRG